MAKIKSILFLALNWSMPFVNVPDCMIVSFPSFSLTLLKAYNISIIRVHETIARQEAWAAEMGEVIATSYTEHQSHDPNVSILGRMFVYGSTPKEAVFRCVVKRFNKEYR